MALFSDWANGVAVDAVIVEPNVATAEEAEGVRVVAEVSVQHSSPVEAVRATVADLRAEAVARHRKEYTITVGTSDFMTSNTIHPSPLPSTLFNKFPDFIQSRHTPTITPLYVGDIILRIKNGLVINPYVTAVSAILGLTVITTFTPLVSRPRIVRLFFCFKSGVKL